ncbi:MAG: hypothetical protein U5R48_08835 [Gammaproteobacteria bacterium]|nr:hypothetical protein [Gammaproteobacteria bacterium]
MVRRWLLWCLVTVLATIGVLALVWPPVLWALVIVLPLAALGFRDALQSEHTVLRNFPLIGHLRYGFEGIRPEIQQYLVESNIDAFPIEREFRSLVYQRAKGELETRPFGTQREVYKVGYEWASHSLGRNFEGVARCGWAGRIAPAFKSALLNISAMSFGALSDRAVLALNGGAAIGGFARRDAGPRRHLRSAPGRRRRSDLADRPPATSLPDAGRPLRLPRRSAPSTAGPR